jgi:hypothetical protein
MQRDVTDMRRRPEAIAKALLPPIVTNAIVSLRKRRKDQ